MGFRHHFLLIFCVLSVFRIAFADLDPLEIYKYPPCNNYVNKNGEIGFDHRGGAREMLHEEFPGAGEPLNRYMDSIDQLNSAGLAAGLDEKISCAGPPFSKDKIHPSTAALLEVTKRTSDLVVKEIEMQKSILDVGIICFRALKDGLDAGIKSGVVDFQLAESALEGTTKTYSASLFGSLKGRDPSPERCAGFASDFENEMTERFDRMRKYMALMNVPPKLGDKLKHDIAYSEQVLKHIFPTLKTRVASVRPLSKSEFESLPKFSRSLPWRPDTMYNQMISTNPILLQITDAVKPETLLTALENLKAQVNYDLDDLKKNPQQEMFLHTPYVLTAIDSMPIGTQFMACNAVSLVHRNLISSHQKSDRRNWGTALAYAINPFGKVVQKGVVNAVPFTLGLFSKRAITAAPFAHLANSMKDIGVFAENEKLCSAVVTQPNPTPEYDDICRVHKNRNLLVNLERETISGAMVSFTLLGSLRFIYRR